MPIIPVRTIIQRFIDTGVVPPNTVRVIIDLRVNDIVRVFYESLGDERTVHILESMILPKGEKVPGV